jgi:predicted O-linked N-acetylglucosamine transferase (SPINDLY family)
VRVGYVSSDFRRHAVATFFQPLLAAHDTARFEIFCYYNYHRGDEVTAAIRDRAEHFVPVAGVPDRVLAERIARDGIDILVDLNGHSADNRLPLFLLAPAPVQVTWLGYPGTTGLATMDYRLTDVHADPPGLTDSLHTETLWRLPATAWCYEPYAVAPPVASPARARTGITLTCLNSPGKASPTALASWADIMNAVPGSRLQLLASPYEQRMLELKALFSARGIAADRIELVARMPLAEYLALYGNADIALDSYPYTGATTTCDALWMGVPVVTLAGDRPFTRSGASILANVGLTELVARRLEDYVRIACELAMDGERLARLRAGLRERMRASRLTDARSFARDVEDAFIKMRERAVGAHDPT